MSCRATQPSCHAERPVHVMSSAAEGGVERSAHSIDCILTDLSTALEMTTWQLHQIALEMTTWQLPQTALEMTSKRLRLRLRSRWQ